MADIKVKFGKNENSDILTEIDKRYIDSLSTLSESNSNPSEIQYGLLESSGKMVVYDRNDYLKNLIDDGTIDVEGLNVEILLNGNSVQKHISSDNSYDKNTKQLSLSLTDRLKDLSILKYNGYEYPNKAKRAYDVLFDVMNSFFGYSWEDHSYFDSMLTSNIIWSDNNYKTSIKDYLVASYIQYPVIEPNQTYRNIIDDFCNMLQLQMYIDEQDNIKFVSARPIIPDGENVVAFIPSRHIYSDIVESIVLKNKYDAVELNAYNVVDKLEKDTYLSQETASVDSYTYESSGFASAFDAKYGVGAKIEAFYSVGEVYIPKSTNNNLSQLISVNTYGEQDADGYYMVSAVNGELPFTPKYKRINGKIVSEEQFLQDIKGPSYDDSESVFATTRYYESGNVVFEDDTGSITIGKLPSTAYPIENSERMGASITDTSYMKAKDLGDMYHVKFKILSKVYMYELQTYHYENIKTISKVYLLEASSVDIQLYGTKRTITFENIISNYQDIESSNNPVTIPSSKLLQTDNTLYKVDKISDYIKKTILEDYKNGVPDISLEVACSNFYDYEGNVVIDWSKGQIIPVGQIIAIDGYYNKDSTPVLWRVLKRELVYENAPMLKIHAQRVVMVKTSEKSKMLFFVDGKYYDYSLSTDIPLSSEDAVLTQEECCGMFFDVELTKCVDYNQNPSSYMNTNEIYLYTKVATNSMFDFNLEPETESVYLVSGKNFVGDKCIPMVYNGLPTALADSGFANLPRIEQITLPNGITEIPELCFYNCSYLTDINLPDSLRVLGRTCFDGCSSLINIKLPEGLKTINISSLSIPNIEEIIIPDSVTTLSDKAFSGADNIKSVTIGNGVTDIGQEMFNDKRKLETVIIGNSVNKIGLSTFNGCVSLTKVSIPSSVTSIGNNAFGNCSSLRVLYIPASVEDINSSLIESPDASILLGCSDDLVVACEADSKPAGWNNYWNYINNYVQSIVVWGVIKITDEYYTTAGYYSNNSLSEKVYEWEDLLNGGYISLEELSDGTYRVTSQSSVANSLNGAFVIKGNVSVLGYLDSLNSLTGLVIPSSVIGMVDDSALDNCNNLDTIMVSNSNSVYDSRNNCNCFIETSTNTIICGCNGSVIPEGIVSIRQNAFKDCARLTNVIIPDSVTTIGQSAFYNNTGLVSVKIGDSVTALSNQLFLFCSSLEDVQLGNSLTSIGDRVFVGCSALRNLYIPKSVNSLGVNVFYELGNLQKVDFSDHESIPTIGSGCFSNCYNVKIVVPDNLYDSWIVADGWSAYADKIYKASEV